MAVDRFTAPGWARARGPQAQRAAPPIGIALGSGYQGVFAALSEDEQAVEIARMQAAGISWVRMDVDWRAVQPDSTPPVHSVQNPVLTYNWSLPDATANAMLKNGMKLLLLLTQSPVWARNPAGATPLGSPWPTVNSSLYAAFCSAAATHYAAMGVHVFELWNEPNLDNGSGSPGGWGYQSPVGYARLAVAGYAAIKQADPEAFVLGGCLATYPDFDAPYTGTSWTDAAWAAVPAGASSATITFGSTHTPAGGGSYDINGFLQAHGWPLGSVITGGSGSSWTVRPPLALNGGFPAIAAAGGQTVVFSGGQQYPPNDFLGQAYAAAAGAPMFDALSIHPYGTPATQPAVSGGWNAVPRLRQTMVAAGDGGKGMWITEVGAPTNALASWTAPANQSSLVVRSPSAAANDVGYQLYTPSSPGTPGIPAGSWISAVDPGTSWTVLPPTGLTLATALTAGAATTTLHIAATPTVLHIPAGTVLTVVVPPASTASMRVLTMTTQVAASTSAGTGTTLTVASAVPGFGYPVGSPVRCAVGQTWPADGTAAGTDATVDVVQPGVAPTYGMVPEYQQAQVIRQVFTSLDSGIPKDGGMVGSTPWPYVGPVFLYCWSDNGGAAGPFGLVRRDGSAKPALSTLTDVAHARGA